MAERLKQNIIDKEPAVDLIAGPDSYRHLPSLLATTEGGQTAGKKIWNFIVKIESIYFNENILYQ